MTLIKKMDLAAQQLLGETLKWSDDVIIDNDIAQLMDDKAASFQCKNFYTTFGMCRAASGNFRSQSNIIPSSL